MLNTDHPQNTISNDLLSVILKWDASALKIFGDTEITGALSVTGVSTLTGQVYVVANDGGGGSLNIRGLTNNTGIEIGSNTGNVGEILIYDRVASLYRDMNYYALSHTFRAGSSPAEVFSVQADGTATFAGNLSIGTAQKGVSFVGAATDNYLRKNASDQLSVFTDDNTTQIAHFGATTGFFIDEGELGVAGDATVDGNTYFPTAATGIFVGPLTAISYPNAKAVISRDAGDSVTDNALLVLQSQTTSSTDGDTFIRYGTQVTNWSVGIDNATSSFTFTPNTTFTGTPALSLSTGGTATFSGPVTIANANAINELTFTGTEWTNILSDSTSGMQVGTTGNSGLLLISNNTTALTLDSSQDATFAGNITLPSGGDIFIQPTDVLWLDGGSNTYLQEAVADTIAIVTGGITALTLDSSSLTTWGTFKLSYSGNEWDTYHYTDNSYRLNYNGTGSDELIIDTSGNMTVLGDAGLGGDLVIGTAQKGVSFVGVANDTHLRKNASDQLSVFADDNTTQIAHFGATTGFFIDAGDLGVTGDISTDDRLLLKESGVTRWAMTSFSGALDVERYNASGVYQDKPLVIDTSGNMTVLGGLSAGAATFSSGVTSGADIVHAGNDGYSGKLQITYGPSAPNYYTLFGYNNNGNSTAITIVNAGASKTVAEFNYDGTTTLHGNAFADLSFRSLIFYDSGDTNYYSDPANSSRLNIVIPNQINLQANFLFDGQGSGPGMQASYNGYSSNYRGVRIGIDGTGNYNNIYLAVDLTGNTSGNFFGQNQIFMRNNGSIIAPNAANNNYMGVIGTTAADYVYVGPNLAGGHTSGPLLLTSSDGRLPILYDNNDTGYYFDGSSTTRLVTLSVTGSMTIDNSDGLNELTFSGSSYTNVYSGTTSGFRLGTTGAAPLYLATNGSVRVTIDGTNGTALFDGSLQSSVDSRGPYFYDYADTSYYINANYVSRLYYLEIAYGSNQTNAMHINQSSYADLYSYADAGGAGWATGSGSSYTNLLYLNSSSNYVSIYAGGSVSAVLYGGDLRSPIMYDYNDTATRFGDSVSCIRGSSPTWVMRDIEHRPAMIHVNSNSFYILTNNGTNDTETWSASFNGSWPLVINLTNNDIAFGGTGAMVGALTQNTSDVRLKENFRPITNTIDSMRLLRGWMYDWKVDFCKSLGYIPDADFETDDIGLKAQDVQKVYPQAVTAAPFDIDQNPGENKGKSRSGEDYLTIRYEKLVPALFAICNEQQDQIEDQQKQIDELKMLVSKLLQENSK